MVLFSVTDVVHIVPYIPDMFNGFRIRSVATVGQPDLEILTVEAACARLVGELMPGVIKRL